MILMMIYHVDGDGDEDKHNLRRRKYVTCIKRKVGINFAQVTKLYLPNDDDDVMMMMTWWWWWWHDYEDDDDDDDNDDEASRKVPKKYSWILNSFTFTLTKLQNFIRWAPCAFQMEMVSDILGHFHFLQICHHQIYHQILMEWNWNLHYLNLYNILADFPFQNHIDGYPATFSFSRKSLGEANFFNKLYFELM